MSKTSLINADQLQLTVSSETNNARTYSVVEARYPFEFSIPLLTGRRITLSEVSRLALFWRYQRLEKRPLRV